MHGKTTYYQYHSQFKDQVSHAKDQSTPYFQLPDNVGSKNLKLTLEIPLEIGGVIIFFLKMLSGLNIIN